MTQEEVAEISMTNNQVEENNFLKKCKNKDELCNNNHKIGWKANTMSENIKGSIIAVAGVQQINGTTKKTENDEVSDNSDDDDLKENEATSIITKDTTLPTTMNLRKFRRATAKKQILDSLAKGSVKMQSNCQTKEPKSDIILAKRDSEKVAETRKRKLSTVGYTMHSNSNNSNKIPKEKHVPNVHESKCDDTLQRYQKENNNHSVKIGSTKIKDEVQNDLHEDNDGIKNKKAARVETLESNAMTLEQFTDIVLASEGMSMNRNGKKSEHALPPTTPSSTPQRKDSLQSSCGGDDEASSSLPTNFSSSLGRKASAESIKTTYCDTTLVLSPPQEPPNLSSVKLEHNIDSNYGCNNNIVDSSTHNAMVANIMNNKDLTVEVKPMRVKPIVLSPRHPHGHNCNFQINTKNYENGKICNNNNPWYSASANTFSQNGGRYYPSARPRIQRYDSDNSSCSGDILDSTPSPLPKGRPPSIPKMVEEWFKKMQPPQLDEEDTPDSGILDTATSDNSFSHPPQPHIVPRKHQLILREPPERIKQNDLETHTDLNKVLNLSTKDCHGNKVNGSDNKEPLQTPPTNIEIQPRDSSKPPKTSKTTQVYLRPIPTDQMIHSNPTTSINTLQNSPKSHLPSAAKHQVLALHSQQPVKSRCPEHEQAVILDRHNKTEQYLSDRESRRHCSTIEDKETYKNQPNTNFYNKHRPAVTSLVESKVSPISNRIIPAGATRPTSSLPTNLEISRIPSYPNDHCPPKITTNIPVERITRNLSEFNSPTPTISYNKNVVRTPPFGHSSTHRESIHVRAVRDIQMAHTKDLHGNYPVHMSVLMRRPELVKRYCCVLQILESTVDLLNDDKLTPLHLAIRDNSLEIIELLLAFGADPALRDKKGNSGLHVAAALGASACLQLLAGNTKHKDDLNELNNCGITPLQISMMNSDKISADILIRSGANLKLVDPKLLQSKHGSLIPLGTSNAK